MSQSDISVLNVSELFQSDVAGPKQDPQPTRRRSNSQSQVISTPAFIHPRGSTHITSRGGPYTSARDHKPQRRQQSEYYVTLVPLNDTFVKKHIHVPYLPETCRLGRPTGTKIKPHVSNGYFDSRVLSRNHACMFVDPKTGQLMIQDMGSSNGTFVNSEKIATEPVPVSIGDTINLGFNIQLETSHKQISARIDNISVVSNNPKGSVLSGLPMLTKEVINNFSATELSHLDFIQSIFAELLPNKDDEVETTEDDATTQAQKAFENAMFADVVPSLDDSLATMSEANANAGIFSNSRIVTSTDLESTLELLMVNLMRVKQQNTTLKSLENFLRNYSTKVDSINAKYVKSEVAKCEAKLEESLKAEREKAMKLLQDSEQASAEHRSQVGALENEIIKLKSEHDQLSSKIRNTEAHQVVASDNELRFQTDDAHAESTALYTDEFAQKTNRHSADISSFDFGSNKSLKGTSPEASEESEEISNSSEVESEDHPERESGVAPIIGETITEKSPYVDHVGALLSHYKNQGVMLGFFVVVAGFLYQSSCK